MLAGGEQGGCRYTAGWTSLLIYVERSLWNYVYQHRMSCVVRQAVNDAASVFGTAHFDGFQQQGGSMAANTAVGAFAGVWHVYALEWTLESLKWHALIACS